MKRSIVVTGDGSKTIQLEEWGEQYHSIHGALQEALHVFILNTKKNLKGRKEIWILEMGFGTGLNALLTWKMAEELKLKVHYVTLEAFPVSSDEYKVLGYDEVWAENTEAFSLIHEAPWESPVVLSPFFELVKKKQRFEDLAGLKGAFDFVFYDSFGPRVQPELWTLALFKQVYALCRESATFLTYCAKGQVRRDLASAGFFMTKLPLSLIHI